MPKIITKTGTPRSGAQTYVIGEIRPTASYIYLADGTKVQAIGDTGQGYEYLGSYSCTFSRLGIARASTALPSAYRKSSLRLSVNGSSVDIESIPFAGGRIVKTSNGYEPQYYITDHLGSTRTVVKPKATVVAEFDYMPYGTQHAVAGAPIAEADYKYTGKEQQSAFGLDNLYDSQARFQYVTDGSFMSHDPLSVTFSNTSPYMYCGGDPINRVDQDGKSAIGITLIMSSISLWEIIAATAATATAYVAYNSYKNRDYGQGYRNQGDQDRKRQEELNRRRAEVQKAINDSCPDPNNYDPNNQGGPRKDLNLGNNAIFLVGLSAQLIADENMRNGIIDWYNVLTEDNDPKIEKPNACFYMPASPLIFLQQENERLEDESINPPERPYRFKFKQFNLITE